MIFLDFYLQIIKNVVSLHRVYKHIGLEWWNGRHEGLKILWPLRLCGFKSRLEYKPIKLKPCKLVYKVFFFFIY